MVIWKEIKEAFPFLFSNRVSERMARLVPEQTWTSPWIDCVDDAPLKIVYTQEFVEGAFKPLPIWPYYLALAALVGLLLLHGLFCEIGIVMWF